MVGDILKGLVMADDIKKVGYHIHHQAVFDCPDCEAMIVEDLGEFDEGEGMIIKCSECGYEFELGEVLD